VVFIVFLVTFFVYNSLRTFEYRDMTFHILNEGDVTFYESKFPIFSMTGDHVSDYSVYIRNDPRNLRDMEFNGDIVLRDYLVLNTTQPFTCDGFGAISIANLVDIYRFMGIKVMKDPNAGCDENGRYVFVSVEEATENETSSIEQFGPACYKLKVSNCEILDVTEKFIIESLDKRFD
jgi:hypothetical protein